jgi:uncharacterized protein YndB with AHSA1/START domain
VSTPASGADRLEGSVRAQDGAGVVRIASHFDTDIDNLWSALTAPDRIRCWYGRIEGDPRVGNDVHVTVESSGWDGTARVVACDAPSRLLLTTRETDESWQQDRGVQPFGVILEAALTSEGERVHLVVEARGIPLAMIAFYGVGWQIHIEHLTAYLDGRQPDDDVKGRFEALLPYYQEQAALIDQTA